MNRFNWRRLGALLAVAACGPVAANTFNVTSAADTNNTNVGTLRWAIAQANASPGSDTITFAIGTGAQTITLNSELAIISDDLTIINGATQPGFTGKPLIRIDGSLLGPGARGLYLRGDQMAINALSITGFAGNGIFAENLSSDGVIVGCYIGLQPDGSTVTANGVGVAVHGSGYYIGGTTEANRNVIAGNTGLGVQLRGSGHRVWGNYIGTNPAGATARPNGTGIEIGGTGHLIGELTTDKRNVISGNLHDGVVIIGGAIGNQVIGNYIGLNASGSIAIANIGNGVSVEGSNNTIGGSASGARNIISGNGGAGVRIDGDSNQVLGNTIGATPAGTAALANAGPGVLIHGHDNAIGSGTGGNIISGNTTFGIHARFVNGVLIRGNRIGLGATNAKLANGQDGIFLERPAAAIIGGTAHAEGNYIAGNDGSGISISRSDAGGALIDIVQNVIGLSEGGDAVGNGGYGIDLYEVIGATRIGLAASGGSNVIAGNVANGINIRYSDGVSIQNNAIGVYDGVLARSNGQDGIAVGNTINLLIGSTSIAGAANVISANTLSGVTLNGSTSGTVAGNRIGTTGDGSAALGNGSSGIQVYGNAQVLLSGNQISGNYRGITLADDTVGVIVQGNNIGLDGTRTAKLGNVETGLLMGGTNHQIGGTGAGQGNVIAGNGSPGIGLGNGGGHHIEGNFIGTNATLANGLGNGNGIVNYTANDIVIGGTAAGSGNVIADNTFSGVHLAGGQNNAILGNRIYGNAGYNIDIAPNIGPNVNDAQDVDQGPNKGQNYPELTSAVPSGANLQFGGALRSRANTQYRIEYFQSPNCHTSGFGQGRTYIGEETVLTNGSGVASLNLLATAGPYSGFATATATDPDGNTSEFGNCISIGAPSAGAFSFMAQWQYGWEDYGVAKIVVTRSLGASGSADVSFATANHAPTSAAAGSDYTATSTTLTFADGETSKTVSVPILHDALNEGMEDFDVNLTSPTNGATLGALASARVAIYDHDAALIRAWIDDASVSEPVAGTTTLSFTVTMGADSNVRVIQYQTQDGTASAGPDYTATSGTLTFQPGETTKTITVPVKADALLEDDEYINVVLSESDPGMQLERNIAVGAILNTGGAAILFADGFEP